MVSDAERNLLRLIRTSAAAAALSLDAAVTKRRDWASALFVGARLTIELAAEEAASFDAWLAALPETELPMRRRFVADADIVERRDGAAIVEFLVVEEG
jgi:hypothetical protein